MKVIQIETFGKPAEVLEAVDIPDVGAPAPGEVVIALEVSPINQYDLLMIAGGYGYRPRLPAIMGTEGAGRVVAVGAGVKHSKEGDRTLVPFLTPTWAERIKTDAPWLRPLPPGDVKQFAMMSVNPPTAYLLLTDIVKLPRESWVIQNGANSGVGRATIAIAKSLGLNTVNVVRRDEVVAEMKALGGNVVLVDGPDLAKHVAAETRNAPISRRYLSGHQFASAVDMERRIVLITERAYSLSMNDIQHIESESIEGLGLERVYFQPGTDRPGQKESVRANKMNAGSEPVVENRNPTS
jgi:NADPH:quinone reductase-like Zn-dependent oxidoreductase